MASVTPLERARARLEICYNIDEDSELMNALIEAARAEGAKRGEEVAALRAELESTREACRVAVAAQAQEDDEVEALREDLERTKEKVRDAFEAGRDYCFTGRGQEHGIAWVYVSFDEWEAEHEL